MRLIDKDLLEEAVQGAVNILWDNGVDMTSASVPLAIIKGAPTVDAVSVVRCKDCRYWRQEVDSTTHWVCVQHSIGELLRHTTPDHFCACGLKCKEAKA